MTCGRALLQSLDPPFLYISDVFFCFWYCCCCCCFCGLLLHCCSSFLINLAQFIPFRPWPRSKASWASLSKREKKKKKVQNGQGADSVEHFQMAMGPKTSSLPFFIRPEGESCGGRSWEPRLALLACFAYHPKHCNSALIAPSIHSSPHRTFLSSSHNILARIILLWTWTLTLLYFLFFSLPLSLLPCPPPLLFPSIPFSIPPLINANIKVNEC